MTTTSRFIRPLLEFLFPAASEETLIYFHALIRKAAHPSVYGVLALLGVRAFARSSVEALRRYWYLAAMWLVAAVAVVDELNQSLLTSRTGTPADVMLDVLGGLVAVAVAALVRGRRPFRSFF